MHCSPRVPTMFIAVLDHPDFEKYNFSTLRTGIMAGSPCPKEVMKRVIEQMNIERSSLPTVRQSRRPE